MVTKKIDKPDDQLGYLLSQTAFLKQRIVNAALKELDITYVQFIILAGTLELGENDQAVTQQIISSGRHLDKAMVSNVVKTLIDKNLMTRDVHPVDKRSFILKLTKPGEEKAIRGKEIALKIDADFFAGIDQEELRKSLKKLLSNDNE